MLTDHIRSRTVIARKDSFLQLDLKDLEGGVPFADVLELLRETFSGQLENLMLVVKADCTMEFIGEHKAPNDRKPR